MTGQEKKLAKKRGRPATGAGKTIGVRLQPDDLTALDHFIATTDGATRPGAIRAVLSDWLAAHGFMQRSGTDHPEPSGPATEAVRAMDAAINEHKTAKRKVSKHK